MLFTEYKNWISDSEHIDVLRKIVYAPKWRFGQVSDDQIEPNYPMWFQGFYHVHKHEFKDECPSIAKTLTERFLDLAPDNYMLVRSMASSNTFGQDGDFHTDWPVFGQSITGVLYTDKTWERNWGGETLFAGEDNLYASAYEPCKLVTFDSSIPHIGKGPQRRCKEMRSILAFQAVEANALRERMNKKLAKSK